MATTVPATDVHNPNRTNKPAPAAIRCGVTICGDAPLTSWTQCAISAVATITLRSRSPWLGRGSANVEDAPRITG